MALINVFLSSTGRDLADYREAAYRAIEGLDGYHCVRMEDFSCSRWTTVHRWSGEYNQEVAHGL